MRRCVDAGIAIMLVVVLGIGGYYLHQRQHRAADIQFVHQSLAQLYEQSLYRAAVQPAAENAAGFPVQMEPAWFENHLPRNVMVSNAHPWMDIAPAGDSSLHPPDPVIDDESQAGIWYNPNRGIFRARVPRQLSSRATVDLYNQLNGTNLDELPQAHDDPTRTPEQVVPLPQPQWQSALLRNRPPSEQELQLIRQMLEHQQASRRPTLHTQ